jgi:parallel beta-helix repeat protein
MASRHFNGKHQLVFSLLIVIILAFSAFGKPQAANNVKASKTNNTLADKIEQAQKMIGKGAYKGALQKLKNDILQKTGGCANEGRPDKNDWIQTCAEQEQMYWQVTELIEYLTELLNPDDTDNGYYYVSPDGNDTNPGTFAQPFATIEKARDTIRALTLPDGGITVWVRGGTYYVDQSIVFDDTDSGEPNKLIVYKAYQHEEPVFCGGKEITGWTLDSGSIYRAAVDCNSWRFDQLFENGIRQSKARYPNAGYLRTDAPDRSDKKRAGFKYKPGQLPAYNALEYVNAQAVIWATANWWQSTMPIGNMNHTTRKVTYGNPYLSQGGNKTSDRYFIQGVKRELDIAGEFYLDELSGYLYYWSKETPIADQTIVAPMVDQIFEFKGTDPNNPVKYINLEGITAWGSKFAFAYTERGFEAGNQSNRPSTEFGHGVIRMENASNITVKNCKIYNAGLSGIYLERHASYNRLYGNRIFDCGTHGICLVGHDPGYGVVSDSNQQVNDNKFNTISNNHIYENGRLAGCAAGIFMHQSSDNTVSHNYVHNSNRYAIALKSEGVKANRFGDVDVMPDNYWDFLTCNNNLIQYNDVHDCLLDSYDAGGISLKQPGRHNIIDNNKIHNITPNPSMDYNFSFGVYLDGGSGYTTVTNNVIHDIHGGASSYPINCKKHYNTIDNNILVAEASSRGTVMVQMGGGGALDYGSHTLTNNILYAKGLSAWLYRFHASEFDCDFVDLSENNLFYKPDGGAYTFFGITGADTFANWKTLCGGNYDQNSVAANPLFADVAGRNFNLKANSPAWALGFEQIDQNSIGLKDDFPAAHSPTPYDGQFRGTFADVLTWTAGHDANTFDVYFGTSYADVAMADHNSNEFIVNQNNTIYSPRSLDANKWYYWKIDEVNDSNIISNGDVWEFKAIESVANCPTDPSPSDNATSVGTEPFIWWFAPLSGADSYDVYFGTDPTPDADEYRGNFTTIMYTPGILNNGTTYYWRVDAIKNSIPTFGYVWRFTTVE